MAIWRKQSWAALALTGLMLLARSAQAEESDGFYRSHNLRIVIGHEVGTGFDFYARLLARYIGKYIVGAPTVIPENMVGVAGLAAANWLANAAPRDGSVIAIFAHTAVFDPLLGDSAGRFDGTQFNWIGNMAPVLGVCGVWENSGIEKFDDLFQHETLFGSAGSGTAGPLTQFPTALRKLLGVKIKLIQGYKGSADIRLAMARGEVHGVCGIPLSTVETEWKDDYKSGRFKIILQLTAEPSPLLPGVPNVYGYAKSDEDRKVFDLIFGLQAIGRLLAAPPKVPTGRLNELRAAFKAALDDPGFRADVQKMQLDIAPMEANKMDAFVREIYASPQNIVDRAKTAVQPN
jgi:tripartite-type tricarboxylate transporter receptor subunit TctC